MPISTDKVARELKECGWIGAILEAMERNIGHPGVCKWGFYALKEITIWLCKRYSSHTHTHTHRFSFTNASFLALDEELTEKCRGIEFIVSVMKTHVKDPEVCVLGCKTLGEITFSKGKTRPSQRNGSK